MFDLEFALTKARLIEGLAAFVAPVTESSGPALRAVPPEHLQQLHDAQLANGIWAQVQYLLANPTQSVDLGKGAVAVRVLGAAIFLRGKSGQLHPFLLESSGELIRPGSSLVMVTEIPYGMVWLDRLVLNLARANRNWSEQHAEVYATWLAKVLKRHIRASFDMRKVRSQIAQALQLDADAWRMCHRIKVGSPLDNKASLRQYNMCVRNKAALLSIEREAPRVLGIYAALCERPDFPVQGEPTQRLKRFLASEGLNSRTWLFVLRSGPELLDLVQQFYRRRGEAGVLDALRVMQGLGVAKALPAWISQAIFAEWGHADARRDSYMVVLQRSIGNLRHMVECLLQKGAMPSVKLEEQVSEVVHWLCEPSTAAFTRSQRQGGWDYLELEAQTFSRRRAEDEAARNVTWPVPFDSLQTGSLSLSALGSASQLLEEGRRMRNCAAGLTQDCLDGKQLLVSVCDAEARRVATASYVVRDGKWVLLDAKGPMNRPLPLRTMERLRRAVGIFPAHQERNAPDVKQGKRWSIKSEPELDGDEICTGQVAHLEQGKTTK